MQTKNAQSRAGGMSAGGTEPGAHYVYCRSSTCLGCLPSDEELQTWHVLALWGEMMARCIAQTPQTKSISGALAAIRADDATYREHAVRKRTEPGWLSPDGRPGRVIPDAR